MILSSDELEILEYLKSWKGKFVSMVEICRCAGGRQKFRESPHWAGPYMLRLVDEKMVEVNDRGHYRVVDKKKGALVGDDYFPAPDTPHTTSTPEPPKWLSPQMAEILKKSGKKWKK